MAAAESDVGRQGDVEGKAIAKAVQEGYDGFGTCFDSADAGLKLHDRSAEGVCFLNLRRK